MSSCSRFDAGSRSQRNYFLLLYMLRSRLNTTESIRTQWEKSNPSLRSSPRLHCEKRLIRNFRDDGRPHRFLGRIKNWSSRKIAPIRQWVLSCSLEMPKWRLKVYVRVRDWHLAQMFSSSQTGLLNRGGGPDVGTVKVGWSRAGHLREAKGKEGRRGRYGRCEESFQPLPVLQFSHHLLGDPTTQQAHQEEDAHAQCDH